MVNNENIHAVGNRVVLKHATRNKFERQTPNASVVVDPNSEIEAINMPFNFKNADTTWKAKHGIVIPTVELQDEQGNWYDDGRYKAILQHKKYRNLVGRNYVVYPNEEVLEIKEALLKDNPDLQELGDPYFTNRGLNMYVTIISEKHKIKIDGSYEENDFVNLGVIIRNSLGGGLALGTDTFTYRGLCQNGAVFGYEDVGSDFMRHYGKNTAKITEAMRRMIQDGLSRFEDIHKYYERMATTPLGEKSPVFGLMKPYCAQKYYPDYVDVELVKTKQPDGSELRDYVFNYADDARNYSLWQVFNDFTKKVWHADDIRIEAKRDCTKKLHDVFIKTAYRKLNN